MSQTLTSVLTTTFSVPASCSSSWTYEGEYYNSVVGGLLMQNVNPSFDVNCFPPQYTGNGRAANNPTQLFSPGVCPGGYTTWAGGGLDGLSTGGEFVGTCCLQSFSYYQTVSTQNFGNTTILYQGCTSTYPLASGSTAVEERVGQADLTTTTITGPVTMWAQPIYIEYRQQDLSLYSTSSRRSTSTSTTAQPSSTASSAISAPTTSSSTGSDTNPSSNELSTGAKAGIGIGAALCALLILSAVLFFVLRTRRSHKQRYAPPEREFQPGIYNFRSEIDGSEMRDKYPPNEMDGSQGKHFPSRKPVGHDRLELE